MTNWCSNSVWAGLQGEWVGKREDKTQPVVLYFHGGGYVVSSAKTHRDVAAHIAKFTNSAVLVLDYRLAPENPFPAAVEDAERAFDYLIEQGISPSTIAVSGDSAGGGLALALMLKLRDSQKPLPSCAVLFSPWADLTCSGESYTANAEISPVGSKEMGLGMAAQYLGEQGNAKDPYASPVFASLSDLPPILIQVSDTEVFLDDSLTLECNAKEAGVDLTVDQWPNVFHAWQVYASALDDGQSAISAAADFMSRHFAD